MSLRLLLQDSCLVCNTLNCHSWREKLTNWPKRASFETQCAGFTWLTAVVDTGDIRQWIGTVDTSAAARWRRWKCTAIDVARVELSIDGHRPICRRAGAVAEDGSRGTGAGRRAGHVDLLPGAVGVVRNADGAAVGQRSVLQSLSSVVTGCRTARARHPGCTSDLSGLWSLREDVDDGDEKEVELDCSIHYRP